MRNLKRVLSLAISAVMLVGMLAVGASAASFTDHDEIDNLDAVNMLVALNVINGMDDGSFDPDGTVTRAQMAKMIYVARNGGKDTSLTGTGLFDDVPASHWAAGYIEWCYNMGIISGRDETTFDPEANVTGSEAAKMILIAIGYDADNSGFTGTTWQTNVNAQADSKGLWDNVSVSNTSADLSRQDAAQMIVDGLEAVMVYYEYNLTTVDGVLVTLPVVTDYSDDRTLLETKFGLEVYFGYMTDAFYDDDDEEYTYTITGEMGTLDIENVLGTSDDSIAVLKTAGVSFDIDYDYSDLFGMQIKVLVDDDGDLYGMYAVDSEVMATGLVNDIEAMDYDDDEVEIDGVDYDLSYLAEKIPVIAIFNGSFDEDNLYDLANSDDFDDYAHYEFVMIDNDDDGDADVIIVYPYDVGKVTYAGSSSITVGKDVVSNSTIGSVSYFDEDIEKDDYVKVIDGDNSLDGNTTAYLMDVVNGEVTSTKSTAQFKVDGTWYTYVDGSDEELALGEEYDLYVVGTFIFADELTSTGSDTLIFISANDEKSSGVSGTYITAEAFFLDGSSEIIYVSEVYDDSNEEKTLGNDGYGAVDNDMVGFWTYDIDDGYYEIRMVGDDNDAGFDGYDSTVEASPSSDTYVANQDGKLGSTYYLADDSIIFGALVEETDSVKNTNLVYSDIDVYTGEEVDDFNDAFGEGALILWDTVDGLKTVMVAYLYEQTSTGGYNLPGISGDGTYGYVISDPELVYIDSTYYMSYTIWTEDGEIDVLDEDGKSATNVYEGAFIKYDNLGDGYVDDAVVLAGPTGTDTKITDIDGDYAGYHAVVGMTSSIISLMDVDGKNFELDLDSSDTVYIYVDTDSVTGISGGSLAVANDYEYGGYVANVVVYTADNSTADVIFIDVNNEMLDDDGDEISCGYELYTVSNATGDNSAGVSGSWNGQWSLSVGTVQADNTVTLTLTATDGNTKDLTNVTIGGNNVTTVDGFDVSDLNGATTGETATAVISLSGDCDDLLVTLSQS